MIDKIAVPFWLCWTVGMLIGLETGEVGWWLLIGAVAGIVVGLMAAAMAKRSKQRAFHQGGPVALEGRKTTTATGAPDLRLAA
jgi:hypothetical protein